MKVKIRNGFPCPLSISGEDLCRKDTMSIFADLASAIPLIVVLLVDIHLFIVFT